MNLRALWFLKTSIPEFGTPVAGRSVLAYPVYTHTHTHEG